MTRRGVLLLLFAGLPMLGLALETEGSVGLVTGRFWEDADCEPAGWSLANHLDPELDKLLDAATPHELERR